MRAEDTGRAQGRDDRPRACPSTPCRSGASVLGVTTGVGRLAYLPMPVFVDSAFEARLEASGRPESRYRFTGPCVEGECAQWTGARCGVIDHVLDDPPGPERAGAAGTALPGPFLPSCGIRADCRWFAQRGAAACAACPSIVTDVGGSATYRSTRP